MEKITVLFYEACDKVQESIGPAMKSTDRFALCGPLGKIDYLRNVLIRMQESQTADVLEKHDYRGMKKRFAELLNALLDVNAILDKNSLDKLPQVLSNVMDSVSVLGIELPL